MVRYERTLTLTAAKGGELPYASLLALNAASFGASASLDLSGQQFELNLSVRDEFQDRMGTVLLQRRRAHHQRHHRRAPHRRQQGRRRSRRSDAAREDAGIVDVIHRFTGMEMLRSTLSSLRPSASSTARRARRRCSSLSRSRRFARVSRSIQASAHRWALSTRAASRLATLRCSHSLRRMRR